MLATHLLRTVALAALVAACGQIAPDPEEPAPDAAPPDPPTADGMPAVVDRSCVEVKARLATAADGLYWIDPDLDGPSYKPFQVFCAGMATPTPEELLELAHTSRPADAPSSNYATYATGAVHASWTCDCGVVTTLYSKLRIDPITLAVSGRSTYAVYSSDTQLSCLQAKAGCPGTTPYAVAMSCAGNYNDSGRANIDLRGVPFHVAGTDAAMFKKAEDWSAGWGFTSAGSAAIDDARKVVTLTGGGDCGGFGAYAGVVLAQDL